MSDVPGAAASHSIITPECRENRTDEGAWEEACRRALLAYRDTVAGWLGRDEQPTFHLVLTVERPGRQQVEPTGNPGGHRSSQNLDVPAGESTRRMRLGDCEHDENERQHRCDVERCVPVSEEPS